MGANQSTAMVKAKVPFEGWRTLDVERDTCWLGYMGVSKNRGTPKWMVYNGKPYQNGWFGGSTIFGNTHMGEEMLPSSMGNAIKHAIRMPDPNNQDAMESRREELISCWFMEEIRPTTWDAIGVLGMGFLVEMFLLVGFFWWNYSDVTRVPGPPKGGFLKETLFFHKNIGWWNIIPFGQSITMIIDRRNLAPREGHARCPMNPHLGFPPLTAETRCSRTVRLASLTPTLMRCAWQPMLFFGCETTGFSRIQGLKGERNQGGEKLGPIYIFSFYHRERSSLRSYLLPRGFGI